jgi:UDP-GlcNAc:undecaprenyl-phosphate/decaprenyl-phosphate GlcNAc-1-phosphate transferase
MTDIVTQALFYCPPPVLYGLAVVLSFAISAYSVKKIIFITRHRKIYDVPDDVRKFHGAQIPSLGGIGIFIGYVITSSLLYSGSNWNYLLLASILLFFTGIYDDIMNMRPEKKLLAQLLASAVLVLLPLHDKLNVFSSAFGYVAPYWLSAAMAVFCTTFFVNVYNFIDGIDGLACSLGIFYASVLGIIFAFCGAVVFAFVSFSLAGAIVGLLLYNRAPAKIYMGDTGSMLIGFTIIYLSMHLFYILANGNPYGDILPMLNSANAIFNVLFSLLFLPVFDAIRVFIYRLSQKKSPLKADRMHLHYYLLDAGLRHTPAVVLMLSICMCNLLTGMLLRHSTPLVVVPVEIAENALVTWAVLKYRQRSYSKTAKV